MDSRGQVKPGSPFPWVLLLVAAGGGTFFWSQRALESSRPSTPQRVMLTGLGEEDVQARLWQDPFDALNRHLQVVASLSKGTEADQQGEVSEPVRARPPDAPHGIEQIADQIAVRAPSKTGPSPSTEEPRVTVIPVMVPSAPYADDAEERLRTRYAVLSALGAAGYNPDDRAHIGYFHAAWPTPAELDEAITEWGLIGQLPISTGAETRTLLIPYEWFGRSEIDRRRPLRGSDHVLILWLMDEALEDCPLARFAQLVATLHVLVGKVLSSSANAEACLHAGREAMAFAVLGPTQSTTLRAMTREALDLVENSRTDRKSSLRFTGISTALEGVRIYSPRATASDAFLLGGPPAYEGNMPTTVAEAIGKVGPVLIRVTCTDDKLLETLVHELDLRGVRVGNADCRVVLISEWDTLYGRAMAETLLRVLAQRDGQGVTEASSPGGDPPGVCRRLRKRGIERVSYLRGLDGQLPGEFVKCTDRAESTESIEENYVDIAAHLKYLERPEGQAQLDYVRRLVDRLEARPGTEGDDAYDMETRAIGVLGSDVYDKLLILQALRERFRRAVFFTTDLDARLLHPDEFPWARNLIVASSFGLTLNEDLQSHIPPFRGTYQTATYLACLAALKYCELPDNLVEQRAHLHKLSPRVFEVGRYGACDLTIGTSGGDAQFFHPPRRTYDSRLPLLFAKALVIVVVICLALSLIAKVSDSVKGVIKQAGTFARKRIALLTGIGLALVLLVTVSAVWSQHYGEEGEPFSLKQGISIWPAVLLRVVVLLLCMYFFISVGRRLKRANKQIFKEFRLTEPSRTSSFTGLVKREYRLRRRQSTRLPLTRAMRVRLRYLFRHRVALGTWRPRGTKVAVQVLWHEYLDRGAMGNRTWRFLHMALIFVVSADLLILSFTPPYTPYRGLVSLGANVASLTGSVMFLILLLFFVVDATRLCTRFIENLVSGPSSWPAVTMDAFATRRGMHWEDLREWLDLKLIVKRTDTIGRLIFYPFAALFLMIMSRLRYFDDWHTPITLATIIAMCVAWAVFCAVHLTVTARKAKEKVLLNLRENRLRVSGDTPEEKKRRRQIGETIDEINLIREGPFAHWPQHPVVQALILPTGGIGLALLELL